jgi:hypothetical protein
MAASRKADPATLIMALMTARADRQELDDQIDTLIFTLAEAIAPGLPAPYPPVD